MIGELQGGTPGSLSWSAFGCQATSEMSEAALLQLTTADGYLMLYAMQVALAAAADAAVMATLAASVVVALVATAPLAGAVASSAAGGACTAHAGCASAHHLPRNWRCQHSLCMPSRFRGCSQVVCDCTQFSRVQLQQWHVCCPALTCPLGVQG